MALVSDSDRLIRHSVLLMAASQVGNLANLLFQTVMGRALAPAEYGALSSMLGATIIVSMPMDAIRAALAHFAATLRKTGHAGDVRPLAARWSLRLGAISALLALGILAASGPLADFWKLGGRGPVMLTGLIMGGMLLLPVYQGALQGLQSFVWMSVAQHSFAVVRLLLAAGLAAWLPRNQVHASAALSAQAAAVAVCLVLGWLGLRRTLRGQPASGAAASGFHLYAIRSLVVLACFAFLMNADVLIVKRFFDADTAGLFARAGTLGRIAVFLPMPIAAALFPKVVGGSGSGRDRATLIKALAGALLVLVTAAGVCSLWPQLPLGLVYGDWRPSADMVRWFRGLLWALMPLGLVYVLMNFEMAQKRFGACYILLPCSLAYVLGVLRWRESPAQVVAVLAAVGTLALVWLAGAVAWQARRGAAGRPPPESAQQEPALWPES
jgi:O-antigen/teichoic acid export membrane protein